MSRFFKSAAFPILIVIVLAFFASKLIASGDQTKSPGYSGFLQNMKDDKVDTVTLKTKDLSAEVVLKGPEHKRYEVGYIQNDGGKLVEQLTQAKNENLINSFDVKPARSSVILSLLTYVFPILIFIGFWIFLMN